MKIFILKKEQDLKKVCEFLSSNFNGGIFLLVGDLGSGKTALVKYFAQDLGISFVSSPTFSVMNNYGEIFHYDIYQIKTDDFLKNGLAENLEKKGWHFVEWADEKLEKYLKTIGLDFTKIQIQVENETRKIKIA